VYFTSTNQLLPGHGTPGEGNLYELRDGTLSYVAAASAVNKSPLLGSDMTPDGNVLVFRSNQSGNTADDNGGTYQLYRYDARAHDVSCISCPVGGVPTHEVAAGLSGGMFSIDYVATLSNNGDTIAFMTDEALVASDTNHSDDIYEWHVGRQALITDGSTSFPNHNRDGLAGVSSSGRDVLFTSYKELAPGVADTTAQLYDARLGGGFPDAPPSPGACGGDACQGAPTMPAWSSSAASSTFTGPGDAAGAPAPLPGSRVVVSAAKAVTGSAANVKVRVPTAGHISASGTAVRAGSKTAARPGTVTIRVQLTAKAKKTLTQRRTLKVKVKVTFSARAGGSSTKTIGITFKQPKKARSERAGASLAGSAKQKGGR
jgi:hypothetical protein